MQTSWQCPIEWYNAGDGVCHCECGVEDPDCKNQTATHMNVQRMFGCAAGQLCDAGHCAGGQNEENNAVQISILYAWGFLIWLASAAMM